MIALRRTSFLLRGVSLIMTTGTLGAIFFANFQDVVLLTIRTQGYALSITVHPKPHQQLPQQPQQQAQVQQQQPQHSLQLFPPIFQ